MIKLDERDIKAIANGRFFQKWKWYFIGYLTFCLILIGGFGALLVLSNFTDKWIGNLVFLPIAMMYGGFGWWLWKLDRAEKKLVGEWKSG